MSAKFLGFNREKLPEDLKRLRAEFTTTVANFKRLIAANRKALDLMAQIEEALEGDRMLGINYVRSCYSNISRNVYKMVKLLNVIMPGKYDGLFKKYEEINEKITPFFISEHKPVSTPLVIPLAEIDPSISYQVGEKMANLAQIKTHLKLKIPDGFVITAKAYWEFMNHNQLQKHVDEILSTIKPGQANNDYTSQSHEIHDLVLDAHFPDVLKNQILFHYKSIEETHGKNVSIAVRSSAQGEDVLGASCAGMYKTELGITGDKILDAYKEVIASKYNTRSIIYRMRYGIRSDEVAICVGCMPMVKSACGGVVYTRNPLDADDEMIFIHSIFGLPGPVADGSFASDILVVSREQPAKIVERNIVSKEFSVTPAGKKGICTTIVPEQMRKKPSINDKQALELVRQSIIIEQHFGMAQDVEWAVNEDGAIVFLQSRPLLQQRQINLNDKTLQLNDDDIGNILASGEVTASSGVSAGSVYFVRQEMDLASFPKGAVLLIRQPLPNWAGSLRNASAVIAEQGSVAGHLANVARELHVPALFRVKQATKIFKNGMIVTVDADRKKIYEGQNELLVNQPCKPAHVIKDTPVYNALHGAAQYTIPLSLLNPDNKKEFRPQNCSTLHDITRFCHEKSLIEMFRFGAEHDFPERAARQLYIRGPSQFWVIDLIDGFKTRTRNKKYIRLDEIKSLPMLAIWDGMMTIPWKMPRVNTRGFFEVLMKSTTNTELNPSMPSIYAQRNYFMITKDYCSCQTRFGYHFSTVEALVGKNRQVNYISLRFRGGAARKKRRVNRIKLIASVLEGQDMQFHIKDDSIHAHLEKFDAPFMKWRLNVIGYIMFHTRQLDMVLTDNNSIAHYKRQIEEDLKILKEKCAS